MEIDHGLPGHACVVVDSPPKNASFNWAFETLSSKCCGTTPAESVSSAYIISMQSTESISIFEIDRRMIRVLIQ
jgi:hypothetical protein